MVPKLVLPKAAASADKVGPPPGFAEKRDPISEKDPWAGKELPKDEPRPSADYLWGKYV